MTENAVLVTDPAMKARMKAIQHVLESELLSASAIGASVISMDALRQFLMRSCPRDDRWTNIPEIILTGELVTDGSEGADITIERLP